MNSGGLALADTAVATTDHGVGWLRYFLMTRLLARHATVAAALEDIRGLAHAGGGSLVLADASGALAAVDLGHSKVCTEPGDRSEEHTSELQSLMRISYAVFCLTKKKSSTYT